MQLRLINDPSRMAQEAAEDGASVLRHAIGARGEATAVTATGIGENGHLAFNDPPADFDVGDPYMYIAVTLDHACRRQQLGEGWFGMLRDVPVRAISMSIRQIMRTECLLLSASGRRKADALCRAIEGPVATSCPASIIQHHPRCTVYLDSAAASCLRHPPLQPNPA
jgi:glucosamine-6-phosphate deaminase